MPDVAGERSIVSGAVAACRPCDCRGVKNQRTAGANGQVPIRQREAGGQGQRAATHGRAARVGIAAAEDQLAAADLVETAGALEHAGERGVGVVVAHASEPLVRLQPLSRRPFYGLFPATGVRDTIRRLR